MIFTTLISIIALFYLVIAAKGQLAVNCWFKHDDIARREYQQLLDQKPVRA